MTPPLKIAVTLALALVNVVMLCNTDQLDVVVFAGTGALCCFAVAVSYVDEWAQALWPPAQTPVEPVNFVSARTLDERGVVRVSMNVVGETILWIDYDGPQLDRLIQVLKDHRGDLK